MLIPNSNLWNVIYVHKLGDVLQDYEGMQIMRVVRKKHGLAPENGRRLKKGLYEIHTLI